MSKIEWTGETWNPLVGCTIHSAGCKGCFAMRDAYRLMHNPHPAIAAKFAGTAKMVNGHAVWTGRINFDETTLLKPLRRRVATTYFVNSMSDLFHQAVTDEQIDRIFAVMALCPQHTFQVLTKRADRMRTYFAERWQPAPARDVTCSGGVLHIPAETRGADRWDQIDREIENISLDQKLHHFNRFWTPEGDLIGRPAWPRRPFPNIWLGVSVEDQRSANERIPDLLATPAAVRFLSCEPLIGPVDLTDVALGIVEARCAEPSGLTYVDALTGVHVDGEGTVEGVLGMPDPKIDWVICGGESGKMARPMHPDWARSLRDQCGAAGAPFFFKQWGLFAPSGPGFLPVDYTDCAGAVAWPDGSVTLQGGDPAEHGGAGQYLYRGTKSVTGRLLDGAEHNGMPAHG